MKNVLKIWLVDNTVTVDNKDDKIGQLESSGNLSLKDILDEMHKEDTGLRPETIEHVVKLYNRVVSDLILSGYSVNTGLYHAVAQLRGVIDGGKWNPEKNSVYVSFTQDKELREAIAQTSISILGERQSVMYVAGFSPATAIAGRPFTVNGRMLKIAGTDSSVGITITDSKEQPQYAGRQQPVTTHIHCSCRSGRWRIYPHRHYTVCRKHAPKDTPNRYRYFLRRHENRCRRRLRCRW